MYKRISRRSRGLSFWYYMREYCSEFLNTFGFKRASNYFLGGKYKKSVRINFRYSIVIVQFNFQVISNKGFGWLFNFIRCILLKINHLIGGILKKI